jgi:hypothetical protein
MAFKSGQAITYTMEGQKEIISHYSYYYYKGKKGKAIPVTVREGPYGCETSRIPHFLNNRLTDGSEAVSLTRRPAALYPRKIPGTHFC